ncbi:uncharacterized protein TrAFT101_007176 [Trichoderma asperellum]|uniref:uncharacterized protein n=1 Tax=Trichoderma asperellum TaxID=101201 RepID=UPI0033240437|nr:hypothetical protein TrAFT101_007176 [Trichoderma asperellum]
MGAPSGRGPRDSAHASGGTAVAYKAQVPVPNCGATTARFGALPRAVANCVVGGDQTALSSLDSSKEAPPRRGVAVRARDSSDGGG